MLKADVKKLDLQKPVLSSRVKHIRAHYNTWTEWKRDPIGYWLFRVDLDKKEIHAGFCKKNNIIQVVIVGTEGESMYNTIVRQKLVKSLQHAAYIGYELQKAEVALRLGIRYIQDVPLHLSGVVHEHH